MDTITLLALVIGLTVLAGFVMGLTNFGKTLPGIFFAMCLVVLSLWVTWKLGGLISDTPAELKNGIYEVRVVAAPQTSAQTDVMVLAQKAEGKSLQYPPKYYKIPAELFFGKKPRVGDELTIELRQVPARRARRELVIK